MSLEVDLRAAILADAGVAALAGTRMHPNVLPQPPTLPALTYQVVSGTFGHTFQAADGLPAYRLQIDAWAERWLDARALADAVRAFLDSFDGLVGSGSPQTKIQGAFAENERVMHETDERAGGSILTLYRVSTDYRIRFVG